MMSHDLQFVWKSTCTFLGAQIEKSNCKNGTKYNHLRRPSAKTEGVWKSIWKVTILDYSGRHQLSQEI